MSAIKDFNLELEPHNDYIENYRVVGRCGFDWRVIQNAENNWSTEYTIWDITSDPLPRGAQVLMSANLLPKSLSSGTVAPAEFAKQTAS